MERVTIIVTRPQGSWKWQKAYALSTYERESPAHPWRLYQRSGKFARTRATEERWQRYKQGRAALPPRVREG